MPGLLDHIAFLSQEVGPRPAGTEEEQQAALYITEQMQKEAGLPAVIEDFNSESNEGLPKAICSLITLVFTILALFLPVMAIPSLIAAALAALVYVLETFDKPIVSKMLARGVSQNVVARYEPSYSLETGGSRRRKIVVMANYDSGKVRAELNSPLLGVLPILQKIILGAVVFVPVFLLVRYLFFLHAEDATAIVLNAVTIIALIFVAAPLLLSVIHKFSPYNEAANCNASGIAVLLEIARRLGRGRMAASGELMAGADGVAIYGEEAARSAGLVPEGAQLVYEAARMQTPEPVPQTEEERLAAAKAAIAAMTGKPVPRAERASVADKLVRIRDVPVGMPSDRDAKELREETREAFAAIPPETIQETHKTAFPPTQTSADGQEGTMMPTETLHAASEVASGTIAGQVPGSPGSSDAISDAMQRPEASYPLQTEPAIPDWFKKAQENAKKPKKDKLANIQRSQYADALEALETAVAESSSHFKQANYAVNAETEERLKKMRDGIMEVSAPQITRESLEAQRTQSTEEEQKPRQGQSTAASENQPQPSSGARQPWPQDQQSSDLPTDQPAQTSDAYGQPAVAGMQPAANEMPGSTIAMAPIDVDDLRPGSTGIASPQAETQAGRRSSSRIGQNAGGEVEPSETFGDLPDADGLQPDRQAAASQEAQRQPIVLPDISAVSGNLTPISGTGKQQRAPLAAAEESSQTTAKSLLNMLPSIEPEDFTVEEGGSEGTGGVTAPTDRPDLRSSLPSLSGSIKAPTGQGSGKESDSAFSQSGGTGSISSAGSFSSAGATGAFAPVGDELLENVDPADIYVDDADDSAYDGTFTETGAFAGPGYVEMPKSRTRKFFDRFRKNKDDDEVSTQQWLSVDEDFDARSAGAARGSWESFQQDPPAEEGNGSSGGSGTYEGGFEDHQEDRPKHRRRKGKDEDSWEGGAFSRRRVGEEPEEYGSVDDDAPYLATEADQRSNELQQIQQFHGTGLDTEVWFVALGSEMAHNGGIRAFLAEHEQDLRGSVIINLTALGSGELSYLEREGFGKAGASSRMKRYVAKASQAVGIHVGPASIRWKESAATIASKRGFQAMSVVGMYGSKPSRYAQGDDVLENIEEEILHVNADFVMELLKNI